MNIWGLIGIIFIIYFFFVVYVGIKKPKSIWNMKKIQSFVKRLGEKGTVMFLIIWGSIIGAIGVWMLIYK